MTKVFLGLGSNMGDREANLRSAVEYLREEAFHVDRLSTLYQTEPVGPVRDQPLFLNCVLVGRYERSAHELLRLVQRVEKRLGRVRSVPQGPRSLDLDILYFGGEVVDDPPDLSVPHPTIPDRRFLLVPLSELEPDWIHPTLGKTQRELLRESVDRSAVERYGV